MKTFSLDRVASLINLAGSSVLWSQSWDLFSPQPSTLDQSALPAAALMLDRGNALGHRHDQFSMATTLKHAFKSTQKPMDSSTTPESSKPWTQSEPEKWVDRHGDMLFGYAMQVTRDPVLSEDLVQETLLAALQSRTRFQGRSRESTWLIGILKHKILDHLRKKSHNPELQPDDMESELDRTLFKEDGSWKQPPGHWNLDPSKAFDGQEFVSILKKCLEGISQGLAQVYSLRDIMGCSTQEICETLNIRPNNLWTRMYRARSFLRRCLETHWFEAD